jgi:hypothetical protein
MVGLCGGCNLPIEEFQSLCLLMKHKFITRDIYSILFQMIRKKLTVVYEIETPCNVHYFDRVVCSSCFKKYRSI